MVDRALWEGRAKAEGLGRWARSEIEGGAASEEWLAESSAGFGLCGGANLAVPLVGGAEVEASDAARRSLSSWYFRRASSGRTPFSR